MGSRLRRKTRPSIDGHHPRQGKNNFPMVSLTFLSKVQTLEF